MNLIQTEGTDIYSTHAVVELTSFRSQHGTAPVPLPFEVTTRQVGGETVTELSNPTEILEAVQEMLRAGQMHGITADPTANLTGFQAVAFSANGEQPNRVLIRPEAKFG